MGSAKAVQVVLVEEGRPVRILLEKQFQPRGKLSILVEEGEAIGKALGGRHYDLMVRQLEDPAAKGEQALRVARSSGPDGELVVLSEGEMIAHEEATELAAEKTGYPFLTRPVSPAKLRQLLTEIGEESALIRRPCGEVGKLLVGESADLLALLVTVERVANSTATVLVQGETGTGKSLVARVLHETSDRADHPFVVVNCGAFQDQLLESELFGHEKGAFTGAVAAKPGLFEVAHGGTLFLDEVAEMSPAMQAKLLQVLDSGEMRRVGGTRSRNVDVRVVSASNKDLPEEVKAGKFREDLLFRLKVITVTMPPLRERREDIPLLVEYFLERHRAKYRTEKEISPAAVRMLAEYGWPGNVRELAHVVEGLVLLAPGLSIEPRDLPGNLQPAGELALGSFDEPLPMSEIERLHIIRTLRHTEGKKAPAARLLGIDVKTLSSKIQNYRIEL